MPMIIEGGLISASNPDILNGTRLANAPRAGSLTLQMQAADGSAAHHYDATVQLPSGDNPLSSVPVPAGAVAGLAGILDDNEMLQVEFGVQQGGQTLFSVVETGDTEMAWRAIFRF